MLTRTLSGLIYGVGRLDPLTFAAVPALLCVVALLAAVCEPAMSADEESDIETVLIAEVRENVSTTPSCLPSPNRFHHSRFHSGVAKTCLFGSASSSCCHSARLSSSTGAASPPRPLALRFDLEAGLSRPKSLREHLVAARPDVLIIFANDHLLNWPINNTPEYTVGIGARHIGPADRWLLSASFDGTTIGYDYEFDYYSGYFTIEVSGEAPVPPTSPAINTRSALALHTPAATVPTPASDTSLTLTLARGFAFFRSWISCARSSIE